jgi:hypothetical protein
MSVRGILQGLELLVDRPTLEGHLGSIEVLKGYIDMLMQVASVDTVEELVPSS